MSAHHRRLVKLASEYMRRPASSAYTFHTAKFAALRTLGAFALRRQWRRRRSREGTVLTPAAVS